jgi:predicted RNA-binding Zn-ribbon protein involved in translation (DUF1610 family)
MKRRKCPECGAEMDVGHIQMRADTGSENAVVDCWFVSEENEDWLVVPSWDKKQACRCPNCGTTLILRGQ